jgi:16S rRNA (cytidine1402-2'-O)-methyltransferase
VGTPIGNLGDLSPRAKETLSAVDFIAAEDTRVSLKLLNHFGIRKPLISYYEHNRAESGAKILSRLLAGESCALVTDAGMPAISDPGEDIVRLCAENGVPVVTVPGPSALIAALAASGLPTQRFCFEGFLSTSRKSRFEHLQELLEERRTMIFYEAPHKLLNTLRDMLETWGDRDLAVCRELTKLHEEIRRTTLSGALAYFTETPPKGEFVLVIRGTAQPEEPAVTEEEALTLLQHYRGEGKSTKEAARLAAQDTGYSKNRLYELAVGKN